MAKYFAMRIEKGKLNYTDVVQKYPEYKDSIDQILADDEFTVNEDGTVTRGLEES